MQPGVIAEFGAGGADWLQPFFRACRCERHRLDDGEIDLIARLNRIARIDEEHGAVLQHDSEAGRAGEPGQPGEPFVRGRHIFVLVAVGARHDETVETLPREFFAQGLEACRRLRAIGLIGEGLVEAFEHAPSA